jgi:cytochrome c peroxidase
MQRGGRLGLILTGALLSAACDEAPDSWFCPSAGGCGWSAQQWQALSALANLPEKPPGDRSNKYLGNERAEVLGRKLFHEPRLSGASSLVDVLRRPVGYARAARNEPINLSCASCHDLARAGSDTESLPGNVSIGAAWADTNALPIFNAAFFGITYWNGRADSLWAQVMNSLEGTNMNGNRLRTAWIIHDLYRAEHNAIFTGYPLPMPATESRAQVEALIETTGARAGQCRLAPGCAAPCRTVTDSETGATGCFPRFPLEGKQGLKVGCQPGSTTEPWGDAYDCMLEADRDAVTWIMVNVAKAVAAFEFKLVSRDSAFDRYVNGMAAGLPRDYGSFPEAAERGARLFIGKGACNECHNTPLMSDSKFHNVGVPQVGPGVPIEADCPAGGVCDCVTVSVDHAGNNCLPWGAADGLYKLKSNRWRRDLRWSDDTTDVSRKYWVDMNMKTFPKGTWRTPSLRNVSLTAPYMHNGSLRTLEEVVEHYNQGGSSSAPGNRSAQLKPLFLSSTEKADLIAFMEMLNGAPLSPDLVNPPELPRGTDVPKWPY